MGKMQVWVDDFELDNEDWRTIDGDFGESSSSDNYRFLVCNFQIEGDTEEELTDRFNETRTEFLSKGQRVRFSLDDTSGKYYADIAPGDGEHTDVQSWIQPNPAHKQTGHRLRLQFIVVAIQNAGSGAAGTATGLEGTQGTTRVNSQFNASRIESRTFQATFGSLLDPDANGPFTIISVEDDGSGNARFVFSAPVGVVFAAGMKLITSGTANYPGQHVITAIASDKVTTETPFGATDTGTATIGETDDADEVYQNQRNSILTTFLQTATDGDRDGTSLLALTVEQVETLEGGSLVNVFLQSRRIKPSTGIVGERELKFEVETEAVQQWPQHQQAGAVPNIVSIWGYLDIDEAHVSPSLDQMWDEEIEPAVRFIVSNETGETPKPIVLRRKFTDEGRIQFQCIYQTKNATVLHYKRTIAWRVDPDYVKLGGTEGFHHVQRPAVPPPTFATVTVSRVGIGSVLLNVDAPKLAGFTAVPAGTQKTEEPVRSEFDNNVWIQSASQAYEYMKFKDGAKVKIAKVFTQSGR